MGFLTGCPKKQRIFLSLIMLHAFAETPTRLFLIGDDPTNIATASKTPVDYH
jgi:hypothetical protein